MVKSLIAENIAKARLRIKTAAESVGRDPLCVTLVVVTKTVDVNKALSALEAGAVDIGESRTQEARGKFAVIGDKARWHMIGSLQTNKAKYCPGLFSMIHSVDRPELFHELSRRAGRADVTLKCLLQVNVSGEKQKSGCKPDEACEILKTAGKLAGLKISGLMTVPPFNEDPEASRPYYRELRELAGSIEQMGIEGVSMRELSMGMSGDFEVAVAEGATIVRLGTAIFGKRIYD